MSFWPTSRSLPISSSDFLDFVSEANLVAHNAGFDMGFINAELGAAGPCRPSTPSASSTRWRLPGASIRWARTRSMRFASATASTIPHRDKHGALLDSELLAEVYIEMNGGRQATLLLDTGDGDEETIGRGRVREREQRAPAPLPLSASAPTMPRPRAFVETLGDEAIWSRYSPKPDRRFRACRHSSWPDALSGAGRALACSSAMLGLYIARNRSDRSSAAESRHCA